MKYHSLVNPQNVSFEVYSRFLRRCNRRLYWVTKVLSHRFRHTFDASPSLSPRYARSIYISNGMDISGDVALGNYRYRLKCTINLYPSGMYCYTTWKEEEMLNRMTMYLFILLLIVVLKSDAKIVQRL